MCQGVERDVVLVLMFLREGLIQQGWYESKEHKRNVTTHRIAWAVLQLLSPTLSLWKGDETDEMLRSLRNSRAGTGRSKSEDEQERKDKEGKRC